MLPTPKVSVVMLVYNREKYLDEAIDSILNQTYKNLELIIIDDGSSDNSVKIAESYTDPRIRLIKNPQNMGIPASRNIGIAEAKGKYIFNFDSDDTCHSDAIRKEVDFLEKNQEYGVCGCFYKINNTKKIIYPSSDEDIKAAMLFNSYISNSALMLRKKILDDYNITYDSSYKASEDYEFFSKLMDKTKFYNLPEFLFNYRQHDTQSSNTLKTEMKNMADEIRKKLLNKINMELPEKDFSLFHDFSVKNIILTSTSPRKEIFDLIDLIILNNKESNYFSEEGLQKIISSHVFIIYGKSFGLLKGGIEFLLSPLKLYYKLYTILTMLKRF